MTRMLTGLLVLALALPAGAGAASPPTNAPPGNSAIDEYLETVPGVGGPRAPRHPREDGEQHGRDDRGALTPAQRRSLDRLGAKGRGLAKVVDATAPARARRPGSERSSAAPVTAKAGGDESDPLADSSIPGSRSPAAAALAAAITPDGGGGLGLVLPFILAVSLLGVVVLVLRGRHPPMS